MPKPPSQLTFNEEKVVKKSENKIAFSANPKEIDKRSEETKAPVISPEKKEEAKLPDKLSSPSLDKARSTDEEKKEEQ